MRTNQIVQSKLKTNPDLMSKINEYIEDITTKNKAKTLKELDREEKMLTDKLGKLNDIMKDLKSGDAAVTNVGVNGAKQTAPKTAP